jgi:hypothetical protein
MKTIIEPFKIKSVEPLRFTSRNEREAEKILFNIVGGKGKKGDQHHPRQCGNQRG